VIILKKILLYFFIIFLLSTGFNSSALQEKNTMKIINLYHDGIIRNDCLIMPELIQNTIALPNNYETSEYLIGSVSVGVFLLESNGAIDYNLEDWTQEEENQVTSEIIDSMTWWENQKPDADVKFFYDWNYQVQVSYEPIIHPSAITDVEYQELWVNEALSNFGYDTGTMGERAYSYVNDLRAEKDTDWAYAIFIVDSSEDVDGAFIDGYFAYSYLGGPFLIMTYDNQRFGIGMMNQVLAHEMGHTFWATDEYNGYPEYSGYLNARDVDGSGCVMDITVGLCVSSGTALQVGWRDTDADSILDIVDTNPITELELIDDNPSGEYRFDFEGISSIQPYPNNNPYRADNNVSINIIENVQYRINDGEWIDIPPLDEGYDNDVESFEFTTEPIPKGIHKIEVKAINSVGNSDLDPPFIIVFVDTNNSEPLKPITPQGPSSGKTNENYEYTSVTTDPDGEDVYYYFDWGDGNNSGWVGPLQSGELVVVSHIWLNQGNYEIKVKAKDINGFESDWSDPLPVSMPKNKTINTPFFIQKLFQQFPMFEKILNQII
jgi:hypothetical protein